MGFLRFRLAILAGFLVIVASVLGLTVVIVDRDQTRQAQSKIRRELQVTRSFFDFILNRRWSQMEADVRLLGSDFAFRTTLATREPATIGSNAISLRDRIGADALWVTDESGRLYADTTHAMKAGRSLADVPVIQAAFRGGGGASIDLIGGKLYQLAAVPVKAPDPMGLLMAGFRFDDKTALELKRLTSSEVSFAYRGRIFASTLGSSRRGDLEAGLSRLETDKINLIDIQGEQYLVMPAKSSPEVTAYLQSSLDDALEPMRKLNRLLVVTSLSGMILTALTGMLIASWVSGSIQELVETTQRLNEELSRLDQVKDEFISTVSHDIRGPVNGLITVIDMMAGGSYGPVTEKQKNNLGLVSESGKRLVLFVSNILDAAKIRAGRMVFRKEEFFAQDMLPPMARLFALTASAGGVTLEQAASEDLPSIIGDREKTEQVINNLIVNAIKFTPNGGRITLATQRDGDFVRFSVTDTGPGIAPEDVPKLFKKFGQADLGQQKQFKAKGTGLGLSICKTIVEGQGGRIWVESDKGKGSSFRFTIPLSNAQAPPPGIDIGGQELAG